jgi:hypothetical protein
MSGVEILGAVASAAQLTDLGIRLLSHISRLCSQFLDHPHVLLKRQHGVEQLVQIAKMIQSTSFPDTDIIHSILEGGVEDARALLAILEPLSPRKNDSKAQRGWKALCGIAKETQVLDLLRQIEERKGALLLCIAVANSKLLSTMDQSIIDLSASAQDAFYKVPSIQQTVEHISGQLQELVVAERAGRPNHPGRRDDSSSMITAVELALPGLDDRLSEIRSLQNSTLQLMVRYSISLIRLFWATEVPKETIRKLLQCSPRGNGIDFVIDSPHSPYQSSTLKSLRHRSGNLATQGSIQSLGKNNQWLLRNE